MEMVEVLTSTGAPTSTIISRNEAHSKGLWHKTVHVWLQNRTGEILLQKRAATKESHPGLWDISCAGHVGAGDSSSETAVRELREELGISIAANVLQNVFSIAQRYENHANAYYDNEIVDVYLCGVPVEMEQLTPDPAEVSDLGFITINQLKQKVLEKDSSLVPHEEEYRRLFAIVLS